MPESCLYLLGKYFASWFLLSCVVAVCFLVGNTSAILIGVAARCSGKMCFLALRIDT